MSRLALGLGPRCPEPLRLRVPGPRRTGSTRGAGAAIGPSRPATAGAGTVGAEVEVQPRSAPDRRAWPTPASGRRPPRRRWACETPPTWPTGPPWPASSTRSTPPRAAELSPEVSAMTDIGALSSRVRARRCDVQRRRLRRAPLARPDRRACREAVRHTSFCIHTAERWLPARDRRRDVSSVRGPSPTAQCSARSTTAG